MIGKRMVCTILWIMVGSGSALAVPETASVRVTDVTPTSFSVVWLTDIAAEPTVQVFQEANGANEITGTLRQTPMPDAAPAVVAAARQKGIMKVRVTGLSSATTFYVRTVTVDPANPQSIGYSAPLSVTTAAQVEPFVRRDDGTLMPVANDLMEFPVYVRPGDPDDSMGLGDLLLLETPGSAWPLTAFAGEGIAAPAGILDLNNFFDLEGRSLDLSGGEKATLRIYRNGTSSTLFHYRKFHDDSATGSIAASVQGFFADFNLDNRVDEADFELFKLQYRQEADDEAFNPDYNLFAVENGKTVTGDKVDAQDFARFAPEFGRVEEP